MFGGLRKRVFNVDDMLFIIACLLTLLRGFIGYVIPVWFNLKATHDDLLFISFANYPIHFAYWNPLSLAQGMSYGVFFLNLVGFSGSFL